MARPGGLKPLTDARVGWARVGRILISMGKDTQCLEVTAPTPPQVYHERTGMSYEQGRLGLPLSWLGPSHSGCLGLHFSGCRAGLEFSQAS